MPESKHVTVIIRLMDGTIHKVQFEPQGDQFTIVSRLEKVIEANSLMFELGDRLLVIPKHAIQTIEVIPAPPKLADTVVRHVRLST